MGIGMGVEDGAELGCVRAKRGQRRGDVDGLSGLPHLELEIEAGGLVQHQRHRAVDGRLKSRSFHREIVGSDRNARQVEDSDAIALYRVDGSALCIFR